MSLDGACLSKWRLLNVRSNEPHKHLKLERASHTACVVDGSVYVIAGRKGSTFFSDLLRLDTASHTWSVLCPAIPNGFRPRANHTATLVGGRQIWVLAGSDSENVFDDVHVLDVPTLTWSRPQLRGDTSLLRRTAHSAELHPCDPRAILVFGGYGGTTMYNDLYVIRTDTLTVERVATSGGVPAPVPRGYHSCTTLGSRCYIYGGRTEGSLVDSRQMLAVYDAASNAWVAPQVVGPWPQARSSHRAVALGNRLLIHGGAGGDQQADRFADASSLLVCPATGRLTWSKLDEPPPTTPGGPAVGSAGAPPCRPQGRSAHSISLVGRDKLYLISGYVGSCNGPNRYSSEVFLLQLGTPAGDPAAAQLPHPSSPLPHRQRGELGEKEQQLRRHQQQQQQNGRRPPSPQPQGTRSPRAASGDNDRTTGCSAASPAPHGGRNGGGPPPSPPPPLQDAAPTGSSRPGARRLPGADPGNAGSGAGAAAPAAQPPGRSHRGGAAAAGLRAQGPAAAANGDVGGGAGAEDDPIDLTAEPPPPAAAAAAASPLRALLGRRTLPQRGHGGGGGGDTAAAAAAGGTTEGVWLGNARRVRSGGLAEGVAAAAAGATGAVRETDAAADARPAKRQATGAAVAAVAAALACGRQQGLNLQHTTTAAHGAVGAGVGAATDPHCAPPAPGPGPGPGSNPAGGNQWMSQNNGYGRPDAATIAAAATAAATAAVAAATGAGAAAAGGGLGNGGGGSAGGGSGYQRPPSPVHVGIAATTSQETLLALFTRLQDDNAALRRQLQAAEAEQGRAVQRAAAACEQQRRTEEELGTLRRGCEMTQAALRSANAELEEARALRDREQTELAAARQQLASLQQQAASAASAAAAAREQAVQAERAAAAAALAEERAKWQERLASLEAECSRRSADLAAARSALREATERGREEAGALGERLRAREAEAAELAAQLRAAAARNQEQQEALARMQESRQRAEREAGEAREAAQRLQRQAEEAAAEAARQRDALQQQVALGNTRVGALEAELRRARDEIAHRDAQHAALLKSAAEAGAELRAAQQRAEAVRQQAAVLTSHVQNLVSSGQAASAVAQALAAAAAAGGGA